MSKDLSSAMANMYITVNLADIRKEMQCPICLGIIRKTRTVMECLHRFCRECIDKSMRLGNNECPSCRTHCASRRSLRDDPNFDALIAALYPDIDKYEEEENALLDDEYRKNQQIQASIAETFRRQSEAVARRRSSSTKATAAAIVRKAHGFRGVQTSRSRGRGRGRAQYSHYDDDDDDDDDEEEEHDGETTSTEETTRNLGRKRRRPRISLSTENSDEDMCAKQREHGTNSRHEGMQTSEDDGVEKAKETERNHEDIVSWAVAGPRSQQHANGTPDQNNPKRLSVSSLCTSLLASAAKERASELHIYISLQPLKNRRDEAVLPDLERPHLSCPPRMTVHHLLQLLELRLPAKPKGDLEVLVEKVQQSLQGHGASPPDNTADYEVLSPSLSLKNIFSQNAGASGNLVLLYRLKT